MPGGLPVRGRGTLDRGRAVNRSARRPLRVPAESRSVAAAAAGLSAPNCGSHPRGGGTGGLLIAGGRARFTRNAGSGRPGAPSGPRDRVSGLRGRRSAPRSRVTRSAGIQDRVPARFRFRRTCRFPFGKPAADRASSRHPTYPQPRVETKSGCGAARCVAAGRGAAFRRGSSAIPASREPSLVGDPPPCHSLRAGHAPPPRQPRKSRHDSSRLHGQFDAPSNLVATARLFEMPPSGSAVGDGVERLADLSSSGEAELDEARRQH